jgi:hypothetical protein
MGWTAGVRLPERVRNFTLLHSVQTFSKALSFSYTIGTPFFPGLNRQGRESDHSLPPIADVKSDEVIHVSSWCGS